MAGHKKKTFDMIPKVSLKDKILDWVMSFVLTASDILLKSVWVILLIILSPIWIIGVVLIFPFAVNVWARFRKIRKGMSERPNDWEARAVTYAREYRSLWDAYCYIFRNW